MNMISKTLMAVSTVLMSGMVCAQSAGTWLIQGGVTAVRPDVTSGSLSAPSPSGSTVDVSADTQPTAQVTRMMTDNIALALPLGLGFKHKLMGAGAIANTGAIGSTKVLPVSLFVQYRFGEAAAKVRPYVAGGLTYARFFDEAGSAALNGLNPANPPGGSTGLSIASKLAPAVGAGVSVALTDAYFVDFEWSKAFLKTTATLSTGQTIATRLDPAVISLSIGMKF
jgi:outer membrane protein